MGRRISAEKKALEMRKESGGSEGELDSTSRSKRASNQSSVASSPRRASNDTRSADKRVSSSNYASEQGQVFYESTNTVDSDIDSLASSMEARLQSARAHAAGTTLEQEIGLDNAQRRGSLQRKGSALSVLQNVEEDYASTDKQKHMVLEGRRRSSGSARAGLHR